MLRQLSLPPIFTSQYINFYISWRYNNSTIKSSTLQKEIQNIESFAKYHGYPLNTTYQEIIDRKRLLSGFSIGRGPLDDSHGTTPLTWKQYSTLTKYCFEKSKTLPLYTLYGTMISVSTFGMLRAGEITVKPKQELLTTILRRDITIFKDVKLIQIKLYKSKTMQRHSKSQAPSFTIPCICSPTIPFYSCGHCMLLQLIQIQDKKWNVFQNPFTPLFIGPKHKPITYSYWSTVFKRIIYNCNIPPEGHTLHALRKTGATLYYLIGVSVEEIKSLGRWESLAWMLYVIPDQTLSAKSIPKKLSSFLKFNNLI